MDTPWYAGADADPMVGRASHRRYDEASLRARQIEAATVTRRWYVAAAVEFHEYL